MDETVQLPGGQTGLTRIITYSQELLTISAPTLSDNNICWVWFSIMSSLMGKLFQRSPRVNEQSHLKHYRLFKPLGKFTKQNIISVDEGLQCRERDKFSHWVRLNLTHFAFIFNRIVIFLAFLTSKKVQLSLW